MAYEIPDAVVDAALREYFRGWRGAEESWLTARRGEMTRAIAAADKARGISGLTLPIEPSGAAVTMAIKSWHQDNWPSSYLSDDVINNLIRCMKAALTAAYAIDGAQDGGTRETVTAEPSLKSPAPSSALRTILRRAAGVSMGRRGFAYIYVREAELADALAELDAMESVLKRKARQG